MYKRHCILALRRKDNLARSARYDALLASARTVHCMQLAESFRMICRCRLELRKATNAEVETIQMIQRASTSGTCGHSKTVWGQRPLASLRLQHCSTTTLHGAPARRHAGQRCVDHLPPPRFYQRRSKCKPCGAEASIVRRQCWSPATLPNATDAAAWRRCRLQPLPGSAGLAQHLAAMPVDPCSIEPLITANDLRGSFL